MFELKNIKPKISIGRKANFVRSLFSIALIFLTSACSNSINLNKQAFDIASNAGMKPVKFMTDTFLIKGFRQDINSDVLYVLIEGDGRAWLNKYTPSKNPTPSNPIGLKIASSLKGKNVLYLSRPCQFLTTLELRSCSSIYWKKQRFNEKVITAYQDILNKIDIPKVIMGYSGGGVIATRLASMRTDVKKLYTFASPLSLKHWTQHHDVSNFSNEDDPLFMPPLPINIKQTHFIGTKDKIVPSWVVAPYIQKQAASATSLFKIPNYTHSCCWENLEHEF